MTKKRIALLPGDGVGPEVVDSARRVLEAVSNKFRIEFEFETYDIGVVAYKKTGKALPEDALRGIKNAGAAIMGAMDTGALPPPSPMGALRRTFDLYADVRPVRSFPNVWCLKDNIDLVIVRENTEGFLADRNLYEGYGEFMPTSDEVLSLRVLTRRCTERIARFAFDLAKSRRQKKIVTVAHKANVLRKGCGFFLGICREIAKDYPEVQLRDQYVDTVANNLIAKPEEYDVILTTNLFGDIISDEAAALVSSLVPTANFGHDIALFRPIHEAMTEIAGTGTVNPIPTILSAAMMLEWMEEKEPCQAVEKSVSSVLSEGKVLTRDLGGSGSTMDVVQAIIKRLTGG